MENKLEFVRYRFPKQEIVTKTGIFQVKQAHEIKTGFVFTDFRREHIYQLEEQHSDEALAFHFFDEKPVVFTPREYYLQAHELLNGINVFQMGKAVFSRIKQVTFDETKALDFFDALCEKYPQASVYLVSSRLFGTWVGASPEILLETHQEHLFTMSLAGTKRTDDADFEWRNKEKTEQALVTDFIVETLEKNKLCDIETTDPYDFEAGPVTHIRTDISARLTEKSAWEIAFQLHPTPAVSGLPRDRALELIETVEIHNRSLYSGMFGWISPEHVKLYVNLRCAQIQKPFTYLYLGGGFTADSIPEEEWIETENKSKTLMNVMEQLNKK